ncbi:hypothetical protein [Umezawaea beigongshangensis]|uniref:hypothetical protein n=1 Tax=Umezawaea beigongshangensis TaxID=2780383 RepID=UPI0018F1A66B|nr:hypothetical protein [Umezawaea beigongshangensis]
MNDIPTPDSPQDAGGPDSVEDDASALSAAEFVDEEVLGVDDPEDVMDPAEHWSAATRFGTTANEQRTGETLDDKLAEEVPDVVPEDSARPPVASTPLEELDQTVDEPIDDPLDDVDLDPVVEDRRASIE